MREANPRAIQQEVQRQLRGAEQRGELIPLPPRRSHLADGVVAKIYDGGISVIGYPEQKAEVFATKDSMGYLVRADDQEVIIKGRKHGPDVPDVLVEGENNILSGFGGKRKVVGLGNLRSLSGSDGMEMEVVGDAGRVSARGEGTSLQVTGSVINAYVSSYAEVTLYGSTETAQAYLGGRLDVYGEVGAQLMDKKGEVRIFR